MNHDLQVEILKELMQQLDPAIGTVTRENVYSMDARANAVPTLEATMEVFSSTIEMEDYVMGEHQPKSAENGFLKEVIFGRNDPALHHFHNSYREALARRN